MRSLSAGGMHTCAVSRDGGVWCWGENASGQIGDGTMTPRLRPTRVFDGAVEVAAGGEHTCARNAAGSVWCWGLNNRGQLGLGDITDRPMPTTPIAGLVAAEITAGLRFSCARDAEGSVYCWGHNFYGQLGDGAPGSSTNRPTDARTPVRVINLPRPATTISAGDWHACARLDNDEVRCWGYNCCGQLGNNVFTPNSEEPYSTPSVAEPMLSARVSGGALHSCEITTQQIVRCWGKAADGALGYGGTDWQWSPIDVTGVSQIVELDGGGTHTCAVTAAGDVWCWGLNGNGEVGDGSMMLKTSPTQLALTGARQLSAGFAHVAVVIDDQIFAWGANAAGELGDDTMTPHPTPAATLFSCTTL